MCPSCDETCDFWYYADACNFARVAFLFDYAGTVLFAAIMALWGKYSITIQVLFNVCIGNSCPIPGVLEASSVSAAV